MGVTVVQGKPCRIMSRVTSANPPIGAYIDTVAGLQANLAQGFAAIAVPLPRCRFSKTWPEMTAKIA